MDSVAAAILIVFVLFIILAVGWFCCFRGGFCGGIRYGPFFNPSCPPPAPCNSGCGSPRGAGRCC